LGKYLKDSRDIGSRAAAVTLDLTRYARRPDAHLKIPLHSSDALDVRLTVDGPSIRREPSGERVNVERRPDLQVPFFCCPAQRTAR
jgi:hypothetical protein